jgi:hypothetical protein
VNARILALGLGIAALVPVMAPDRAAAQSGLLAADLSGYAEVPAVSSRASGAFSGTLSDDQTSIDYTISWNQKLTSDVTQAHLHFAQAGVNGAIVVFLCTNLGNGPVGTQSCPVGAGEVSGSITAAEVGGIASAQGIDAGQFGKLVRALKAGALYANVHTTSFPAGEIRGQVAYTPAP